MGIHRMTRALAAVATAALLLVAPAAYAATESKGTVEIARLVITTPVRSRPGGGRLLGKLGAIRPLTSQQTAVPVRRHGRDKKGNDWLRVPLPGRPLGRVGWIPAANATIVHTHWRLVVDRKKREATLYRDKRAKRRFEVVVGKATTPTPKGHFFLEEHVPQSAGSVLGPWALATSAFSTVLQEFGGSPGQVALHGRSGALLNDPLGTAASHGCIRFDNRVIRQLSALLPNGTPIDIR
jgi:lipoprotein-anchoring transpeptidase ErfK/SrfK